MPVEELEDTVEFVGDLTKTRQQHIVGDGKHRVEMRQMLEHPAPFVHAAHPLHQDPLRRRLDHDGLFDRSHLDLELTGTPDEGAIHRLLAAQAPNASVDNVPFQEEEGARTRTIVQMRNPALPRHLKRLEQIDDAHVRQGTAQTCPGSALGQALLGLARKQHIHTRDQFANGDRLGEVVLDS